MTLNLLAQPSPIQPAYNSTMSVLTSTNSTQKDFKMLTDIWVNGSFLYQMATAPNLTGLIVQDSHRHLENAVTINTSLNIASLITFTQQTPLFAEYQLFFGEEFLYNWAYTTYYDTGGFVTLSSSTRHYFSITEEIAISGETGVTGLNDIQTVTTVPDNYSIITDKVYLTGTTAGSPIAFKADFSSTQILSGASSSVNYVYAAGENINTFRDYNYNTYVLATTGGTGTPGQFLTNISDTYTVRMDDIQNLFFYNSVTDDAKYLEVTSDTGVFLISNGYSTTSTANKFLYVSVGPDSLNNTMSTVTVVSGALPIIGSATTAYSVRTVDLATSGATSISYDFTIDRTCLPFTNYKLGYLDAKGSFITVNFALKSKANSTLKKTDYIQNYGEYDGAGGGWVYGDMSRGKTTYTTDKTRTITINSNWVSEENAKSIQGLIDSPFQYSIENGELYSINITTSNYEEKKKINEKLINYDIKFEYAFNDIIARG